MDIKKIINNFVEAHTDEIEAAIRSALSEEKSINEIKAGDHFEYKGIEWVCLDVGNETAFAVTAKVIANMPFNNEYEDGCNNWRTSSLRKWLNGEFLDKNFDKGALLADFSTLTADNGDDKWANMLGGTELIRKKLGKDAYAMTITLLLNSEGKKMGKTEKGAVWLDPEKTSPYEFYQYWRNVGDADVIKCLKMLTFVPIEEIEEMEKHMEGAEYNKSKELLAYELTKLFHGKEEADKADAAAKAIFAGGGNSDDMPSTTIAAADLTDGKIGILTLLVKCGLCPSNGEARRLVTQNGIAVNGEKFTDPKGLVDLSEPVVIKKGKKIFHRVKA